MTDRIALALISGGLDSILAAKIMAHQPGLLVVGYYFHHPFEAGTGEDGLLAAERGAFAAGVNIIVERNDGAFIEMVEHPKHGVGKGCNPCRDCRIFIFRRAGEMLKRIGGDFLITGEVVGQRPMSQMRNSMNLIANNSGLKGMIVRPLCGKLLPESIPEEKGWIDREIMLDISGRGRKRQIELAREFGIVDFPTPAGGCILTQTTFSSRFLDLISHSPGAGALDIETLKIGRHFRLLEGLKLIIPRNKIETEWVESNLAKKYWLLYSLEVPGPVSAMDREPSSEEMIDAASLVASYSKGRSRNRVVMTLVAPDGSAKIFEVAPADKSNFRDYIIY